MIENEIIITENIQEYILGTPSADSSDFYFCLFGQICPK